MANISLASIDLEALRNAKLLLEHPSLAVRIANAVGIPIEKALEILPRKAHDLIATATRKSLQTALAVAISTMDERPKEPANLIHKATVAVTGAAGGAFGLPALAIELPLSTTVILHSIADIARGQGEAIKSTEAKLACLEVFALGGRESADDAAESGYFPARNALAKALSEAARYIAERGFEQQGAPALVRFITQVAARFSIPVSEKAAAQSLPIIGAAGGALINMLFIDHFQSIAQGHFLVRRLERKYCPELVKKEYQKLPASEHRPAISTL